MSRFVWTIVLSVAFALVSPLLLEAKDKGGNGKGGGGGPGGGGGSPPSVVCDDLKPPGEESPDVDAFVFVVNDNANVAVFGFDREPHLIGPIWIVEVDGWNPVALTFNSSFEKLYVADRTQNKVHVFGIGDHDSCREFLDVETHDSFPTGLGELTDIELNPSESRLYVSARGSESGLAYFDVDQQDGSLSPDTATSLLGDEPVMRIAAASDDVLYLSTDSIPKACTSGKKCKNPDETHDRLIQFSVDTDEITGEESLSHFDGNVMDQRLRGVAVTENSVFVAAFYSNAIWQCDLALDNCHKHEVGIDYGVLGPWGFAINQNLLYVASWGEFTQGSVTGEGASLFAYSDYVPSPPDPPDPPEPLEQRGTRETNAGRARNIVLAEDHAFVTDFDGALTVLSIDPLDGALMASFSIPSGGELTKELAVVPAP